MTRRDRTLDLLQSQETVTTAEFLTGGCGSRFGARIQELRDAGYVISAERIRDGAFRYKLENVQPVERRPSPAGSGLDIVCDARQPGMPRWYPADFGLGKAA